MPPSNLPERLVHWAKNFLNSHIGFPHFSDHYLRRHIERPETEVSELQEYRPKNEARLLRFLGLSSLVFACCSLLFPWSVMQEFNLLAPSANFQPIQTGTARARQLLSFGCLATDCTRLQVVGRKSSSSNSNSNREKLARDFLELPLFSICHPWLSFLQSNIQFLGPPGLLVGALLTFSVLLSGLLLPLFQVHFSKSGNLLLMMLLAPRATRRVVLDRALELYDELEQSRNNFRRWLNYSQPNDNKLTAHDLIRTQLTSASLYDTHLSKIGRLRSPPRLRGGSQVNREPEVGACNYRREFADDCVTIMRSNWWQLEATRSIYLMLVISLSQIPLEVLSIWYLMAESIRKLQLKTRLVGELVQSDNCTIWAKDWHHHEEGARNGTRLLAGYRVIDFTQYQIAHHTLIAMLPAICQCVWPFICVTIFMVIYLMTSAELTCWLYEIRFQLRLVIEYMRQLLATPPGDHAPDGASAQHFRFEESRHLFRAHTKLYSMIFVTHRKLSLDSLGEPEARAMEALVARSIGRHSMGLRAAIEMLEKLHVSFRLFVEHVHHYGSTITLMVCFINTYTYGFVVVSIWYLRNVDNRHPLPYAVMMLAWISVNYFIGFASNFHAKAKILHPLIHSLLASTCQARHFRLRHMRNLWLKQVGALDRENGLALKAFNLSITYVRIMQLVIGSGTLVVFALRGP